LAKILPEEKVIGPAHFFYESHNYTVAYITT